MSGLEYVRKRTPTEEKADAVRTVEQAARRGDDPRQHYRHDELIWCLGCEAEIDRIAAVAAEAREQRARAAREQQAAAQLRAATYRILEQWDSEEKAARYARAETLAREELGL